MRSKFYFFVILSFFALILSFSEGHSQGIRGKILTRSGKPIPFANIYIPSQTKGTASNIEGKYELRLKPGKYKVTYQYLGYETQSQTITIKEGFVTNDVVLKKQHYQIPEIIVYGNGEDPAYHIMRKAIAMAQYYKNQVRSYDCRVYLKGSSVFSKIPGLLKKQLKKDGIEEGEYFITENISDIHFELPNKVDQKVVALRTNNYEMNINPMSYITLSLYHDVDGIVSPLAKRALNVYEFELVNGYYDKGRLINKIKVIPKREGYDLFSGYIHIANDFWNIHSVDLKLEQKMFEVNIRQLYSPVKGEIWLPVSHHFDVDFSAMGFKGHFQYAGSVDYEKVKRNEKLDHSFLAEIKNEIVQRQKEREEVFEQSEKQAEQQEKQEEVTARQEKIKELSSKEKLSNREAKKLNRMMDKEIQKKRKKPSLEIKDKFEIADSARKHPVAYWDSIRPIPLSPQEKISYTEKDSVDILMEDPEYRDSVKKAKNKFKFKHLLGGHSYRYEDKNSYLRFSGLLGLKNISFNTVDGFVYGGDWFYTKRFKKGKRMYLSQDISYAFAREKLLSDGHISYRYDGIKRASVSVSGGRKSSNFHRNGMSRGLNMLTSLFLRENYLKLFQEDYINLGHYIDIVNGLRLYTAVEYSANTQLFNNTGFYIWDPFEHGTYTSNIPNNPTISTLQVSSHNSLIFKGYLTYTPRYFYRIDNHSKRMAYSKYPTFRLRYRQGVRDILNSDSRFQYLEFSISQNKTIKGLGRLTYRAKTGKYLNNDNLYFANYKHFATNEPFLASRLSSSHFRLLNYYEYSTNKAFAEAHVRLSNDRILLKRLPVLNKTLIQENIYLKYLKTAGRKNYYEIGYGLDQVFLMLNLEVFAGFEGSKHKYTGFKICLPMISGSMSVGL